MLKTMLAAIAIALTAAPPPVAVDMSPALAAASPELRKLVQTDIGHEAAGCAAFYELGYQLGQRDWPGQNNGPLHQTSELAFAMGRMLLGDEVAGAAYKIATEDMSSIIKGDTDRMTLVIAKYGSNCKSLIENPEPRIIYWLGVERAGLASAPRN